METSKNALIQKWLDNWALFRSRYKQKCVSLTEKSGSITRRVRRSVKWRRFSTQAIRKELVRDLGELYENAIRICKLESLEVKDKERWFRLCGYLAQTINTLTRSYDDLRIEDTLKGLEKYVKENIEG